MTCEHCAETAPHDTARCFHCACTACGQFIDDAPFVCCVTCHSHTHVACVAHGAHRLAQQGGEERLTFTATSAPANADSTALLPSSSHRLGEAVREPFRCCADCAMDVQLYDNPFFDNALSATIERLCTARWRHAAQKLSLTCPAADTTSTGTALPASLDTDAAAQKDAHAAIEWQACRATYLQLRYEAWRAYYEAEPFTSAHPSLLPPTCLQLDDVLVGQLSELLSPDGQARRLCALDARSHPVGSVLALPNDALWSDEDRLAEGETNSYVAESRDCLLRCETRVVTLCGDVKVMLPKSPDLAAADAKVADNEQGLR